MSAVKLPASEFARIAASHFSDLQARICAAFESFEPTARFQHKSWSKPEGHRLQGGGQMRVMRGQVFEKVGVNVSHVWGAFAPQHARAQEAAPPIRERAEGAQTYSQRMPTESTAHAGVSPVAGVSAAQNHLPPAPVAPTNEPGAPVGLAARDAGSGFIACGISLVAHMVNPYVPAVHMNLRYLLTNQEWFGGGSDLTPTFPFEEDTADFHAALREPCEVYEPGTYQRLKEWCDRYFYLPHRQEPRGVGGIFFDELSSGNREADFEFVKGVGEAFLQVYPKIVARRVNTPYDDAARERLLVKRGRYVEFNLVYDRGTKFGFGTDADPEAYLMSLPPLVKW
jgi:coproporphyrinogen III oxidase